MLADRVRFRDELVRHLRWWARILLRSAEAEKIISITDVIGWLSIVVLLATICRQVYLQWKSKATSGVSHWLFVGQISASIGFICYSYQLHN
jgi:hypothetical protein